MRECGGVLGVRVFRLAVGRLVARSSKACLTNCSSEKGGEHIAFLVVARAVVSGS